MRLRDFAEIVNGTVIGDPDTVIAGVAGVEDARKGDITFAASERFLQVLRTTEAACVIVRKPFEGVSASQLIVKNPHYAFAKAIECFYPGVSREPGISDKAHVSDEAIIGEGVVISSFAYVERNVSIGNGSVISPGVFVGEGSKIGSNCFIYPNVTVREKVSIGDRVIVHSGTVIGSDGFGYVFENGVHYKIPQVGGVVIEDDVEIGSNVSVDRATLGNTLIGKGTKIDNLAQIAHNVKIGEKSLIVAQVGIGGSSKIGSFVTLAGQVGVADHTTIAPETILTAQSGISGRVAKGIYSGSPAFPHNIWLRAQAAFAKLPELIKKIRELENRLNKVEKGDDYDEHK
ncbi:MAG TPA: UDP-3-O-(3-hydroxymyristoyl)glucosamine N-acyltransferase [Candidatus Sulfobium mesophilum]|nr:UDP-3-O-(3-hydroxymyristoyl)glucosamine N-acyltransferase [Candidatus Sulfobium mesophilum]